MRSRFLLPCLIFTAVASAFALGLTAGKDPAAAKPVLRRDASPVGDGKAAVVSSYADVVEPVQRAVVSIYSTKTVRIPANPLLRQFFGDQIPDQELRRLDGFCQDFLFLQLL